MSGIPEALARILDADAARRETYDVVCGSGLVWCIRIPGRYSPEVAVRAVRLAAERAEMMDAAVKTAEERELSAALVIAEAKHHPEEMARLSSGMMDLAVATACEVVVATKGLAPTGTPPGVYRAGQSPILAALEAHPIRWADGRSEPEVSPPVVDARSFLADAAEVAGAAKEVEGVEARLRSFPGC